MSTRAEEIRKEMAQDIKSLITRTGLVDGAVKLRAILFEALAEVVELEAANAYREEAVRIRRSRM